ncbi:MAG: hypothetical protein LBS93_05245, partial [Synergistaceae bacterium]|nr:hypothetical protein [Synergistaceae bacterium]
MADSFEGGKRVNFGGFTVLDLRGTWRGMGRQYGALASAELLEMYGGAIEGKLLKSGRLSKEAADAVAQGFYANYPHRLKEVVAGLAETSGLDFSQHLLL